MSQFSFSISKLISNLINQPNKQEYISLPDEEIKATTIRLDPAVRKFCDDQAEKLGTSIQSFITMVLNGVMLESVNPVKATIQLIYERFFEVFKEHNIAVVDIPSILNEFNLSLSILADKDKLIDVLNDNLILAISQQFEINPDWLKGNSDSVVSNKIRWYKNTYSFCSHLADLYKKRLHPQLMFIKSDKAILRHADAPLNSENEIIPVIRLQREYRPGKWFYYYQVCEGGDWGYWRARCHLKTIIIFCRFLGISLEGFTIQHNKFIQFSYAQEFVNQVLTKFLPHSAWCPKEYVSAYFQDDLHILKTAQDFDDVYLEFTNSSLDKLLLNEKKLDSHPYLDQMKKVYDLSKNENVQKSAVA